MEIAGSILKAYPPNAAGPPHVFTFEPEVLSSGIAARRHSSGKRDDSDRGSGAARDMMHHRYWLPLSIVPLLFAGCASSQPGDETSLLTNAADWKRSGAIGNGAPLKELIYSDLPKFSPGREDALYWGTTLASGDGSGRAVSRPFKAPGWLTFAVSGDLTRPGNEVFLQLAGENRRIRVNAQTQPYCWRRVTVAVPGDWVGKSMEMGLDAGPRKLVPGDPQEDDDFVGVTNPRALAPGAVLRSNLRALAILPACLVSLVLFVLPGLPLAAYLGARGVVAPSRVPVVAVIFSCLAGYLTFWAYLWQPLIGYYFGTALLLGGAGLCLAGIGRGRPYRSLFLSRDITTPLALTAVVALFYASLWLSVNLWVPFRLTPRLRFLDFVPNLDNVIPYFFADHLYQGSDPRRLLVEYQSSDRPPLQAGILLLQLPLGYLLKEPEAWSLVFGFVLQCLWVPAAWEFWQSAGVQRQRAGLAVLFVVLNGFLLVNSVYTWPKLLSAALTLNAMSLALFDGRQPGADRPYARAALWGLAAALGFLSHSGVAFTLLPFGLFLLLPRYYPGLRSLAIAAGVFLVVVAPWSLYQSLYDPPGTKLIRQHLAGDSETWQEGRPVWRNLLSAYQPLTAGQIAANKLTNVEVLFRASEHPGADHFPWPPLSSPRPWPVDAVSLRRCEFLCFFWAPGLLNLGWIAAVVLVRRRTPLLHPTLGFTAPALALASIAVWVLLMFGPGTTVIHQGSYATLLLLLVALAAWLAALPGWLPYVALAAQGGLFALTWLFTSPANDYGIANPFLIGAAVLSFALLVRMVIREPRATVPVAEKGREAVRAKPVGRGPSAP